MTLTILFLFQANRVLELALHLEKTVINLKIDALRMWNIALVGMACGNLLTLIENAYGYPESRQSIECGQYLETVEWEFAENEPDAEPAKGLASKEAATAKATSQPPPAKRRKQLPQGPDKCKLQLTGAVIPTTMIHLHQTGVPKKYISERVSAEDQSIYKCMDSGCPYLTAQFAQCCTHIHKKHLGVCIKCQLCDCHSFRSVDIQKHLKDVHMNNEDKWFEPVSELEGDIVEINETTLQANIALVKEQKPDEDDDDDDLEYSLPLCVLHIIMFRVCLFLFGFYVAHDQDMDCFWHTVYCWFFVPYKGASLKRADRSMFWIYLITLQGQWILETS